MAIIRGGKRIGPFDIRAGVSREDLQGVYTKQLKKKDPVTRESTINRFRSQIAQGEGFARPSRYTVEFQSPRGVSSNAEENDFDQSRGSIIDSSGSSIGKPLSVEIEVPKTQLMCSAISFPGRNLSTTIRNTHGPSMEVVDGVTYGEITATFYCDKFMREKQAMENWQRVAYNPATYNVNFYNEYTADVVINQLGSFSDQNDRDRIAYSVRLVNAFPKTINAQQLSYDATSQIHKIEISFVYRYWINQSTEAVNAPLGQDFTEKDLSVIARDESLLRNLPFGLNRTLGDTANSLINQIPIGQVFGGKVFPPF